MPLDRVAPLQFVFKVTSRCNLNCSYCYVFNKADQSWRSRPRVMSEEVFRAALVRIRRHCAASGQDSVRLMFHGGEPLLAGAARFRRWFDCIREEFGGVVRVLLAIQTNAVLVDDEWSELFAEYGVEVGVSIDGPQEWHDRYRVDHAGRGSYADVVRGMELLRRHDVRLSILSVIPLGADGASVYGHLRSMEPGTVNFLFPDFTNDDIAAVRAEHGPTPVADFLIPVADSWYGAGAAGADVPLLRNICRIILGGRSRSDMFGNPPLGFVFVESDGEIEGLDVLRVDGKGIASSGLNVFTADFSEIAAASPFHDQAIFRGVPLPGTCAACVESQTCAGGYLPHRYSRARGFDNPSAWCADILLLFEHLRRRLNVDAAETMLRRSILAEMAAANP